MQYARTGELFACYTFVLLKCSILSSSIRASINEVTRPFSGNSGFSLKHTKKKAEFAKGYPQ